MTTTYDKPLTATIDGIPAVLPELTTPLPDGRVGYFQRNQHDCLRAAVATATQVPYDEVNGNAKPSKLEGLPDAEARTRG